MGSFYSHTEHARPENGGSITLNWQALNYGCFNVPRSILWLRRDVRVSAFYTLFWVGQLARFSPLLTTTISKKTSSEGSNSLGVGSRNISNLLVVH
jgi:hypothetical protein